MATSPPLPPSSFNEAVSTDQNSNSISFGSTSEVTVAGHSKNVAASLNGVAHHTLNNLLANGNGNGNRNIDGNPNDAAAAAAAGQGQMDHDRDIASANGKGGKGHQYLKKIIRILKPFYVAVKAQEKKKEIVNEVYHQLVIIDKRNIFKYTKKKFIILKEMDAKEKIRQSFRDWKKFENNISMKDDEDIVKEAMKELYRLVEQNSSTSSTNFGCEASKRKGSSSPENNDQKRLRRDHPLEIVYIYPKKINRRITAEIIELLDDCPFPEMDEIESSAATKWFHREIGNKSHDYLRGNKGKRDHIVNEIFKYFQNQLYEMVYLLEEPEKMAIKVPSEKEIKRAIRQSLEASQKKPPATDNGDNGDDGGDADNGDEYGPSGNNGAHSRRHDQSPSNQNNDNQNHQEDHDGNSDNNSTDDRGPGGDTSGPNRQYQASSSYPKQSTAADASCEYRDEDIVLDDPTHPGTLFFSSLIDDLKDFYDDTSTENKKRTAQFVAGRYDEFKKNFSLGKEPSPKNKNDASNDIEGQMSQLQLDRTVKEGSIKCGDKDIVLDDPTHPGTMFFNSFIDNLKDLYAGASATNEESIAQVVMERYNEFKKKYSQGGEVVPKKENSDTGEIQDQVRRPELNLTVKEISIKYEEKVIFAMATQLLYEKPKKKVTQALHDPGNKLSEMEDQSTNQKIQSLDYSSICSGPPETMTTTANTAMTSTSSNSSRTSSLLATPLRKASCCSSDEQSDHHDNISRLSRKRHSPYPLSSSSSPSSSPSPSSRNHDHSDSSICSGPSKRRHTLFNSGWTKTAGAAATAEDAAAVAIAEATTLPRERDILCGSNCAKSQRDGNKYFQTRIRSYYKNEYRELPSNGQTAKKTKLIKKILREFRENNRRFMVQNDRGQWEELNEKKAHEKISQKLRDMRKNDETRKGKEKGNGKATSVNTKQPTSA